MNSKVINLETVKKAQQLSRCIRLINNKDVHYLDLVKKFEEKSKNLQKSLGVNHHQKA